MKNYFNFLINVLFFTHCENALYFEFRQVVLFFPIVHKSSTHARLMYIVLMFAKYIQTLTLRQGVQEAFVGGELGLSSKDIIYDYVNTLSVIAPAISHMSPLARTKQLQSL